MKANIIIPTAVSAALMASAVHAQSTAEAPDITLEPAARRPLIPDQWYQPALAMAYVATPPIAYFGSETVDSYWPVAPALFLAPSIHWASHRGWRAGISLVMQPVAAYTGWMAGIILTRPSCAQDIQDNCGHDDAAMGILVGYLGWAIADVVLVSDVKPRPLNEEGDVLVVQRSRWKVRPVATMTPSGQLFGGVIGQF
jgi:hypothetical protein